MTRLPELNQMQDYVGREMVEEFRAGRISRRTLVHRLFMIFGGMPLVAPFLSACGDDDQPPPVDPARPDAGDDAASGDAAAASPTDAAAVDTAPGVLSVPATDPAVEASKVTYASPGATITGYLAKPKAPGTYPAVLVIHENRGLNDHIRDVARRVAKANFIALAPDLTSRWGTTEVLDPDTARTRLSQAEPAQLVADLSFGINFLATTAGVAPTDKFGVVGFCMGGAYTLRIAASNPKVAAAVPYYGPAPEPIDAIKTTNAAILAHYAETDDNVNRSRDALAAAMAAANKVFLPTVHPGTRHAFNNDTGANYNEAAAVAAWAQTLAWFEKYLRAK